MASFEVMGNGILTSIFCAHFTPGSVDIPIEDHAFCMIVCVYMYIDALPFWKRGLPWSRRQLLRLKTLGLLGHFLPECTKALQGC